MKYTDDYRMKYTIIYCFEEEHVQQNNNNGQK